MDNNGNWFRLYFSEPLYNPNIFLVIYGDFNADFRIPGKYRITGMPDGINLMKYGPDKHPEVVHSFCEGYVWDELESTNGELAESIENSEECFVITGETSDTENLEYFRNVIGMCTYLLDHGGVGIYDPYQLKYWTKDEWIETAFEDDKPNPFNHVVILKSLNEDGTSWFHTRGLLKYGRPDLSLRKVPSDQEEVVFGLFKSLVEFQALGGIIFEGQKITAQGVPPGMQCSGLKGSLEDPDFNNMHIEILW